MKKYLILIISSLVIAGLIWFYRFAENNGTTKCELKYEYGPIGKMDWKPEFEEGWDMLERIPWYLEKVWIQPVIRDEAWFQSVGPILDAFWKDVDSAKQGQFLVPESSVKKKPAQCAILDIDD